MAKPILVVRYPKDTQEDELKKLPQALKRIREEYHVILLLDDKNTDYFTFEVVK